jgi:hypothetical protein
VIDPIIFTRTRRLSECAAWETPATQVAARDRCRSGAAQRKRLSRVRGHGGGVGGVGAHHDEEGWRGQGAVDHGGEDSDHAYHEDAVQQRRRGGAELAADEAGGGGGGDTSAAVRAHAIMSRTARYL